MRKILLLIITLLFFGVNSSFSAWYGSFTQTIGPGTPTWCATDGDTTGGSPTFSSSPLAGSYTYDSKRVSKTATTITCQRWDASAPNGSISLSPSAWTNLNVQVNITCTDAGGSGCNMYAISGWTISGNTYSRIFSANTTGSITLRDNAGLTRVIPYSVTNIDKTAPTISDIGPITPSNGSNLSASETTQNFSFSVGNNGGSPINYIGVFFEDSGTVNNFKSIETSTTGNWSKIESIKNVDLARLANGSRTYTLRVSRICDQAGNCIGNTSNSSTLKDFTFNVYAKGNNLSTKEVRITDKNNLEAPDNIADGTVYPLIITLKDEYGNEMVPATGINRTIDFNFNVLNTLHLNQFDTSGTGDAVYLSVPSNPANYLTNLTSINSFASQPSTNGVYPFSFKVYSPTQNVYPLSNGGFAINSITYDINSNLGNYTGQSINNSSIDFQFLPIYTTTFGGDFAATGSGLVEGNFQTGSIDINKNLPSVTPSGREIHFVQTGTGFTGTGSINLGTDITIPDALGTSFINSFNEGNYTLKTLFNWLGLSGTYVDDIVNIRLKEYIRYTIDSKIITYLAGVINNNNTQNFETLKIYGITNIGTEKQKDLIENQGEEDIKNLEGEIIKSGLKRDIRKAAINTVKFIDDMDTNLPILDLSGDIWNDSNNGGKSLGNILYYDNLTSTNKVEIGNNLGPLNITGRKTIIVKGRDLYIKSNIINSSTSDILGIIVLKDDAGKGGKLYIDTEVSEVDAIIYTDKSIITYNEYYTNGDSDTITRHEADGNISNSVLQKQLYILGTIFSENTIGGARLSPPICPFWTQLEGLNCDIISSQRYDLNYLRAGYSNKKLGIENYPVIIKYNPAIQSTPPPLFENR